MQYAACTPEDIWFLNSHVASKLPGHLKLTESCFYNVSIITAWNSQKDKINKLGCERFAKDTGQQLTTFYSMDNMGASNYAKTFRGKCWILACRSPSDQLPSRHSPLQRYDSNALNIEHRNGK